MNQTSVRPCYVIQLSDGGDKGVKMVTEYLPEPGVEANPEVDRTMIMFMAIRELFASGELNKRAEPLAQAFLQRIQLNNAPQLYQPSNPVDEATKGP